MKASLRYALMFIRSEAYFISKLISTHFELTSAAGKLNIFAMSVHSCEVILSLYRNLIYNCDPVKYSSISQSSPFPYVQAPPQ